MPQEENLLCVWKCTGGFLIPESVKKKHLVLTMEYNLLRKNSAGITACACLLTSVNNISE